MTSPYESPSSKTHFAERSQAYFIEVAQVLLPTKDSAALDLINNVVGTCPVLAITGAQSVVQPNSMSRRISAKDLGDTAGPPDEENLHLDGPQIFLLPKEWPVFIEQDGVEFSTQRPQL
jgi:hypothetical protein